jgi:hypothetical protein
MEALEEDASGNGAAGVALDLTGVFDPPADVEEGVQLLLRKTCQRGTLLLWDIVNGDSGVSKGLERILILHGHLFLASF